MSRRKLITEIPGVAAAGGAYSPAVVAGGLCFTSGQLAIDPGGQLIDGGIEEQTRLALANLLLVVDTAGFDARDICQITVLLSDFADWGTMNEVYREVMEVHGFPARVAFSVAGLPPGALIEIQATAVRPGD